MKEQKHKEEIKEHYTKEVIVLDYGQHKEIMRLLNVSYPTIRRALSGETMSKKALMIREMAIKLGGKILIETVRIRRIKSY